MAEAKAAAQGPSVPCSAQVGFTACAKGRRTEHWERTLPLLWPRLQPRGSLCPTAATGRLAGM